jgi:hypothetical protein
VRLWGGGLATALVAGLIVFVGVLIARGIFNVAVLVPRHEGTLGDSSTTYYVLTAVAAALVATALLNLLLAAAPAPLVFFFWIVGLATIAAALSPFMHTAELRSQLVTGAINIVVGLAIASLLNAVANSSLQPPAPPTRRSPGPPTYPTYPPPTRQDY